MHRKTCLIPIALYLAVPEGRSFTNDFNCSFYLISVTISLTGIRWIRQAFEVADKNKDLRLDFDEVMKLLKTLNADMNKAYVREMFNVSTRQSFFSSPQP